MHGNSRVKISRSFDFDAARYNGVFRGIFGEGGGRGGKGLVLEGPGFNKIRDMHRSPLRTYIYICIYAATCIHRYRRWNGIVVDISMHVAPPADHN